MKLPKGSIFGCPCVKDVLSCWIDLKLLIWSGKRGTLILMNTGSATVFLGSLCFVVACQLFRALLAKSRNSERVRDKASSWTSTIITQYRHSPPSSVHIPTGSMLSRLH